MGRWSLFREHKELEKGVENNDINQNIETVSSTITPMNVFFDGKIFNFGKAIKLLNGSGGERFLPKILDELKVYLQNFGNPIFPETKKYVFILERGIENFSVLIQKQVKIKKLIKQLIQMQQLDEKYKNSMRKAA